MLYLFWSTHTEAFYYNFHFLILRNYARHFVLEPQMHTECFRQPKCNLWHFKTAFRQADQFFYFLSLIGQSDQF
jgi:hypothetical protein